MFLFRKRDALKTINNFYQKKKKNKQIKVELCHAQVVQVENPFLKPPQPSELA